MSWKPHSGSSKLLFSAQRIINEYPHYITFKQLYYRLVAEGELEHSVSSYRKLKNLILNARKHGRFPPNAFIPAQEVPVLYVPDPAETLQSMISTYHVNRLAIQDAYVEVWVEREPVFHFMRDILGVFDIPVFLSEGYSSYAFTYQAYQRLSKVLQAGKLPRIAYFCDLSPASHSIFESVLGEMASLFDITSPEMSSLLFQAALAPEHVVKYDLIESFSCSRDQRVASFEEKYGTLLESVGLRRDMRVELESLDPKRLRELTLNTIFSILDYEKVLEAEAIEEQAKDRLRALLDGLFM